MSLESFHHAPPQVEQKPLIDSEQQRRRDLVLRQARSLEREERREEFFEFFVTNKMLERFEDDLTEFDVDAKTLERILSAATDMNFREIYAALSYPSELRDTFIQRLLLRVYSGALAAEMMLPEMANIATKNGFSIGFHLSKFDIRPDARKRWMVVGKEEDHRDSDLPMAYYAREFKYLYNRKLVNSLYVVRAENTHRVGEDKKWWRAPTLSIVQKIPIDELRSGLQKLEDEMRVIAKRDDAVMDEEE